MDYIKIPAVYNKLKKAEETFSPVIMTAAYGWGKSAAIGYYYRRKKTEILFCEDGRITRRPPISSIRANIIIIEDLQWLKEQESIQYLKDLLHSDGRQIVMATRGAVPKYLVGEEMQLGFVRIVEQDFVLGKEEVKKLFLSCEVEIDPKDIELVTLASQGYPPALMYYVKRMENGKRYSEEMYEAVWRDIYYLWDGVVYEQWNDLFIKFALCVCQYEEFTEQMAEYLMGNDNISKIIEYCRETMHQLNYCEGGFLSIRKEVRGFFCWKQSILWSKEAVIENYRRGANYYEMHGDIPKALEYYRKAGAVQRIKELLVRNANTHPGTGHYVETKEYYFELPKEQVLESPVLMAGMSMLYDLLLQPQQSEKWYQELVNFEKNKENPRELRREARTRLAYLDITLPHRGTKGILRILRNSFVMITKGDVFLPEMSVTGNLPSIMNGGLDFCEWSKSDTQIAKFMSRPIEVVVGKYGNGLVTIALAESGFEKATISPYEVMTRCCAGYEAASHGGKIEMCFVSVGIQVRQHIVAGQIASAKRVYRAFEEKVRAHCGAADHLLPKMEAFCVWISLFEGTGENVHEFVDKIPDVQIEFCILDRYRQLTKLRCLIAENRLEEALSLANFLTEYFYSYQRYFYWMENEVLRSIILYRMGDEHWREHLISAVKKAAEYHFVRVISMEGQAVLPLLRECRETKAFDGISADYLDEIYNETGKMAVSYPDYLIYIPETIVSLTKREEEILAMLCTGMTTGDICEQCAISYDGLKKHNRNIYKKLGAKNRAEAERRAIQLGLVHRGSVN